MSTSRSVFLWTASSALVVLAAFLWGAPWRQGEVRRVLRTIQHTLLVAGLALMIMITVFPEQIGSRFAIYSETLSPDSPASELVFRARDYPLKNFLLTFQYEHWLTGYGIGTSSLGTQYVMRIFHVPPMGVGVENGYGQIILELGIVGFALWLALSAAIILSAWKIVKGLRQTPWFPIAFCIFWYAFLLLIPMSYIGFVAYQDYVMNAYLWLMLGILFRLPDIARQTALAKMAEMSPTASGQG
jgi:O-antigen ligase